jgi:hypothetical protein
MGVAPEHQRFWSGLRPVQTRTLARRRQGEAGRDGAMLDARESSPFLRQ